MLDGIIMSYPPILEQGGLVADTNIVKAFDKSIHQRDDRWRRGRGWEYRSRSFLEEGSSHDLWREDQNHRMREEALQIEALVESLGWVPNLPICRLCCSWNRQEK